MRKSLVSLSFFLIMVFGLCIAGSNLIDGCSTAQTAKFNQVLTQVCTTVEEVAAAAPAVAQQLDAVYAFLVQVKAVPNNMAKASVVLAQLDQVAPMVQSAAQGVATAPNDFGKAQVAIAGAVQIATTLGYQPPTTPAPVTPAPAPAPATPAPASS
jgi:outer membrane murein-binding lipoprotein Lpp